VSSFLVGGRGEMSLPIKQFKTIEERVHNFQLYYQKRNPRPLFGFFLNSEFPLHRYHAAKDLPEHKPLMPENLEVEKYLDDCDRLFQAHEECGGDSIWSASAFWGIPWLEAGLGCPIIANHKTGSIYSESPKGFNEHRSIHDFDRHAPWMEKAREFLVKMGERSNGKWPLGTTRMRGISDLLSALYGGEAFIYAMLDEPDEIKSICEKITKYWIEFGRFQLESIPLFHGGVGSFYYHMWAPAGTIWHQEDAASLMSPALYDEFIRPWDEIIVKSFPGCIIHLHPAGFFPVDKYIKMGLLALELHIDQGGPSAEQLYETHIKILKNTPLVIWGDLSERDLDWIFTKLPARGLAINKVVRDKDEATRLWNQYMVKR
jgi:hypothetical protein